MLWRCELKPRPRTLDMSKPQLLLLMKAFSVYKCGLYWKSQRQPSSYTQTSRKTTMLSLTSLKVGMVDVFFWLQVCYRNLS